MSASSDLPIAVQCSGMRPPTREANWYGRPGSTSFSR